MSDITKEELINAKEIINNILIKEKIDNVNGFQFFMTNFYKNMYQNIAVSGLGSLNFNENDLMKALTVLGTILTYEESHNLLLHIRKFLLNHKKCELLRKKKFTKLSNKLSNEEIYNIKYEALKTEKSSHK